MWIDLYASIYGSLQKWKQEVLLFPHFSRQLAPTFNMIQLEKIVYMDNKIVIPNLIAK
jgi:hypothetical protein